jgi:hypothetical protein
MQQDKTGIILNIDGVLTNLGTYVSSSYLGSKSNEGVSIGLIDSNSLRFLKVLCDQAKAEVIIYSSWAAGKTTAEAWRTFFGQLVPGIPVEGVIPAGDYVNADRRAVALQLVAAKFSRMVLISDDIDEWEADYPYVRTSFRTGFQLEHLRDAATLLGAASLAANISKELERVPKA